MGNLSDFWEIVFESMPYLRPLFVIFGVYILWKGIIKPLLSSSPPTIIKEENNSESEKLSSIDEKTPEPREPLSLDELDDFYASTHSAWLSGKLSALDKGFEKTARRGIEGIKSYYPCFKGSAIGDILSTFKPSKGEYLISVDKDSGEHWFLLTNLRFIVRDGLKGLYKEINLYEVDSHWEKGITKTNYTFFMKNDSRISVDHVKITPFKSVLEWAIGVGKTEPAQWQDSKDQKKVIVDDGKPRCPECGAPYDLKDYRNDVDEIFCSACKAKLK